MAMILSDAPRLFDEAGHQTRHARSYIDANRTRFHSWLAETA